MDQSIQLNKIKNIFIYIVVAAVILAGGYYFGVNLEKFKINESRQSMLKEIFSSVFFVGNLSGKILEISSDKKFLTVEVSGIYGVNLPKDYQKKRILIDENTKIVLRTNKDAAVFEKEMAELKKKEKITQPLPYIEKEIKIDGLKIGDVISFNFLPDENVNILSAQFTPVQINVNR